jgi:hypothetical protein
MFHTFSYFQLRIKVTKICVKVNTEFAQLLQTRTRMVETETPEDCTRVLPNKMVI